MLKDERNFNRFNVFIVVELKPLNGKGDSFFGITRNFSSEGFSFESKDYDLKEGEKLECTLKQSRTDLSVKFNGEIVWKKKHNMFECQTGIRLLDKEKSLASILEILSAVENIPINAFLEESKSNTEETVDKESYVATENMKLVEEGKEEDACHVEKDIDQAINYTEESHDLSEQKGPKKKNVIFVSIILMSVAIGFLTFWIFIKTIKTNDKVAKHSSTQELSNYDIRDNDEKQVVDLVETPYPLPQIKNGIETERKDGSEVQESEEDIVYPVPDSVEKLSVEKVEVKDNEMTAEEFIKDNIEALSAKITVENVLVKNKSVVNAELKTVQETVEVTEKEKESVEIISAQENKNSVNANSDNIMVETTPLAVNDSTEEINELTGKKVVLPDIVPPSILSVTTIKPAALIVEKVNNDKVNNNTEKRRGSSLKKPVLILSSTNEKKKANKTFFLKVKKRPVFNESYENNSNKWDVINTHSASVKVKSGKYIIENKRDKGIYMILYSPDIVTGSDYVVTTSIKKTGGFSDYSYGIIWGARNSLNYNAFQISSKGGYLIGVTDSGKMKKLSAGETKHINNYSLNILKISRQGNVTSFFINGKYIDKISDLSLVGSKIGFIVEGKIRISVDDVSIMGSSKD